MPTKTFVVAWYPVGHKEQMANAYVYASNCKAACIRFRKKHPNTTIAGSIETQMPLARIKQQFPSYLILK